MLDLAFRLLDHFLDARRVDAPIRDQLLERDARDLAAHRIESGQRDRLRRIVDYQIDAGQSLDRADVAALAADDASLHLLAGQRHHGDRRLRDVIACAALARERDDLARLAVRLFLELALELGELHRLLVAHLRFESRYEHRLCLLRGHTGDLLKFFLLLFPDSGDLFLFLLRFLELLCELFFLLFEVVALSVERFLLRLHTSFLLGKLGLFLPADRVVGGKPIRLLRRGEGAKALHKRQDQKKRKESFHTKTSC